MCFFQSVWVSEERDPPEERVVLHAHLPQPLGCAVVGQLKADCALKLLKLQNKTHVHLLELHTVSVSNVSE